MLWHICPVALKGLLIAAIVFVVVKMRENWQSIFKDINRWMDIKQLLTPSVFHRRPLTGEIAVKRKPVIDKTKLLGTRN